jgi:hypothetical protein
VSHTALLARQTTARAAKFLFKTKAKDVLACRNGASLHPDDD